MTNQIPLRAARHQTRRVDATAHKLDSMPREAIAVMLEMLAPDEPFRRLMPTRVPYTPPLDSWPQSEIERGAKYRAYQPDKGYQFHMKFGLDWRAQSESVRLVVLINFAKAVWSREIQVNKTQRQFVDWMPLYLNRPATSRDMVKSGLGAAGDFLREKYGLPLRLSRRSVK